MLSATTIVGHLAKAPELRQTPTGKDVTTLRVGVNDHRALGGQPRFFNIDVWEDQAHHAVKHLVKGQQVAAEGFVDAETYVHRETGEIRIAWKLQRARVEWGHRPKDPNAGPDSDEPAF
ncbi:MAG: single-stranded DNA-binding protein [Solirubrobacteraceae bacterium]|nr:single-stranded DNA-binding protein [Solirubrobacteraceae bacterium]